MKAEIEIKFYPINKDETRDKLTAAGFKMIHPEFKMIRIAFHNPSMPDRFGRVRREFDNITMSIKCPKCRSIDGMLETDVTIDDFEAGVDFMEAAGFHKKSYQETLREKWVRGNVEATIDTWPGLEPCVEIEAVTEDEVHAAAEDLGFEKQDALFGGIDFVYEKCTGIPAKEINFLPEITFENPPRKKS
jgi:predicted adenylyl cyclase CyaB